MFGDKLTYNVIFYYLIGINVLSFLIFCIDKIRHAKTGKTLQPTWIFAILTLAGGSIGTNLYFLFFFRKYTFDKYDHEAKTGRDYYRFWRLFAAFALAVHLLIALTIFLPDYPWIKTCVRIAQENYKVLLIYFAAINVVTMTLYGVDKARAADNKKRIKEATLILFPLLGGTVGALLGMKLFHHKGKKLTFAKGLLLILVFQILLVVAIILKCNGIV